MDSETIGIYEARAQEWETARPARRIDKARQFGRAVASGSLRADLGCGPGSYTGLLGRPIVALDASKAMLARAREKAPHAMVLAADLEALPMAPRSLRGVWARNSYLHLPRVRLPLALAQLHWAMRQGARLDLGMIPGTFEGHDLPGDDFPGRFFSLWSPEELSRVLVGAGFEVIGLTVEERQLWATATRARSLPDTVGRGMRVLICGLNPSTYAADHGVGFSRPGNRFWPAALRAKLVQVDGDPLDALASAGIGMTDLVKRATTSTSELSVGDFNLGMQRVRWLVRWLKPRVVCFVGLEGYRAALDRRAVPGQLSDGFEGAIGYLMPSTSGRNASSRLEDLVDHLEAVTRLAS